MTLLAKQKASLNETLKAPGFKLAKAEAIFNISYSVVRYANRKQQRNLTYYVHFLGGKPMKFIIPPSVHIKLKHDRLHHVHFPNAPASRRSRRHEKRFLLTYAFTLLGSGSLQKGRGVQSSHKKHP